MTEEPNPPTPNEKPVPKKFSRFDVVEGFRGAKYSIRSFTDSVGLLLEEGHTLAAQSEYEKWFVWEHMILNDISGFIPEEDAKSLFLDFDFLSAEHQIYKRKKRLVDSGQILSFKTPFYKMVWMFDRKLKAVMAKNDLLIPREGSSGQAAGR